MKAIGYLDKMESVNDSVVQYYLNLDNISIDMNALIGQPISFTFLKKIKCVGCGTLLNKSYAQGFCYNCLQVSPLASECILNPEKCKAHLGISREMAWSEGHCLTPHIVYLAWSSQVKVGVTRLSQIPTRWIDQGAIKAIKLAELPNRHIAGITEVFLKKHFSDKTAWLQMLSTHNHDEGADLLCEKQKAIALLPGELKKFVVNDDAITTINYPYHHQSGLLESVGFDKLLEIKGLLTGIKGQYLILDNRQALNIRKHTGYRVELAY